MDGWQNRRRRSEDGGQKETVCSIEYLAKQNNILTRNPSPATRNIFELAAIISLTLSEKKKGQSFNLSLFN